MFPALRVDEALLVEVEEQLGPKGVEVARLPGRLPNRLLLPASSGCGEHRRHPPSAPPAGVPEGVVCHPHVVVGIHLVQKAQHAAVREPVVAVHFEDDPVGLRHPEATNVVGAEPHPLRVADELDVVVRVEGQPLLDEDDRIVRGRIVDEDVPDQAAVVSL